MHHTCADLIVYYVSFIASLRSKVDPRKTDKMSALGCTAYLDQSIIIKQGCSSQGSYCVNDLLMIDYPVGWAPGGLLVAKHGMLHYAILNCCSKLFYLMYG